MFWGYPGMHKSRNDMDVVSNKWNLSYQCITVRPSLSVRPFVHLLDFFYILLKDLLALFYIELMYFNIEHAVS